MGHVIAVRGNLNALKNNMASAYIFGRIYVYIWNNHAESISDSHPKQEINMFQIKTIKFLTQQPDKQIDEMNNFLGIDSVAVVTP